MAQNVLSELRPEAKLKGLTVNKVHPIRSHYRVFALEFKRKDVAHDLS